MDINKTDGDRGRSFVRGISLICALGAVWLTVAVTYAAWVGLFG